MKNNMKNKRRFSIEKSLTTTYENNILTNKVNIDIRVVDL